MTSTEQSILRVRLLVAALGERVAPSWWRTEFLSPTGLRYVERIFPRNSFSAALQSATIAARRDHDASIGTRSFHLFRLPAHRESQLIELLRAGHSSLDYQIPDTADQLIDALEAIAGNTTPPTGSGPKSIGSAADISKPASVTTLAGMYAKAARSGKRTYPYFEAASDE
jgi:hypothetical protein